MQIWDETSCLSSIFYLHCPKSSCSFGDLDSDYVDATAESWECWCTASPGAAGDGIDKTRGQRICTAGSSTKWGLFWLINIELLLSNSKLYPALRMSIFARGWAADRGSACEFISSWLGDECALLFTQQLVSCSMMFGFFLVVWLLLFFSRNLGVFTQCRMLFSSCPHCILYVTIPSLRKNWCNKFVHAAFPKFSSVCGRSSKGHIHLRNTVTVAWNGNFNAWKISFWFILLVQMKITMMVQVGHKINISNLIPWRILTSNFVFLFFFKPL